MGAVLMPMMEGGIEERNIELLRRCLTRSFPERTYGEILRNSSTVFLTKRYTGYSLVRSLLSPLKLALVQTHRAIGEVMVSIEMLKNVHRCMREVRRNGVPGDFVEAGVWRGGVTIYMAAFLDVYNEDQRKTLVVD